MSEVFESKQSDIEDLVAKFVADPQPDLRDLLIIRCAPIVERIARKFAGLEPVDDLTQVGYIGLLNALSKFSPDAGVRFNTYATHLIAGEIKHYLRDRSMTIRHPAWLQELRHKVNKASRQIQADSGEVATPRAIADYLEVSVTAVEEVLSTHDLLRVGSLDATTTDSSGQETENDTLDTLLVDGSQPSIEDRVVLEQAIEQLRELERDVLVLFHFESLNQTEIASRLGISCNYVSHILRQSLSKLRRILTNDDLFSRSLNIDPSDAVNVLDKDTGLYTHAYFKNRLSEELHRVASIGGTLGLIRIHVTGLRISRDPMASQSVKELIQDAAFALKDCTRSLDVVCREGQYGFAVIMPSHGEQVLNATQRIENALNKWLVGRVGVGSTVRLEYGYACAPENGTDLAKFLTAAHPADHGLRIAS